MKYAMLVHAKNITSFVAPYFPQGEGFSLSLNIPSQNLPELIENNPKQMLYIGVSLKKYSATLKDADLVLSITLKISVASIRMNPVNSYC